MTHKFLICTQSMTEFQQTLHMCGLTLGSADQDFLPLICLVTPLQLLAGHVNTGKWGAEGIFFAN